MSLRRLTYCVLGVLLLVLGCAKSEEARSHAQRAQAGLMPADDPQYDASYVSDQAQAKTLPAREISYKSLEDFSAANQAKPEEAAATDETGEGEKDAGSDEEKTEKPKKEKKTKKSGGLLKALGEKLKGVKPTAAKDAKSAEKGKATQEKAEHKDGAEDKKKDGSEHAKPGTAAGVEKKEEKKDAEESKETSGEEKAAEGGEEGRDQQAQEGGEAEGGGEAEAGREEEGREGGDEGREGREGQEGGGEGGGG